MDNKIPTLKTERLILRKFTDKDMEAIFTLFKDTDVNTFLPWFPLKTPEEAEAIYLKKFAEDNTKTNGYIYAVCLKTDNLPIGHIQVKSGDDHSLGYALSKKFWHQGIVTEAGRAVLEQVKRDGLLYVTATHDVKNPRSGEVMIRLGMRYRYTYEEHWMPKDFPATFRMYQLNFDGQEDRVYQSYWDHSSVHFVEENL